MGTTLVVNPGSSSRKYALYNGSVPVCEWRYESIDGGFEVCVTRHADGQTCHSVTKEEYEDALAQLTKEIAEHESAGGAPLQSIVIRVVSPGTFFQSHQEINDSFITKLTAAQTLAPLHVPPTLREIQRCKKQFPGISLLAASDSAFHVTIPARARDYSIAEVDRAEGDIHRFGYHGLSVASVVRRTRMVFRSNPTQLVVCHIGSGVSVTAVHNGNSVDTTMSYAPASGLVMGSRAGDLDASGLLALMRLRNFTVADAELYLNTRGGLFGLAGQSDIRRLLDAISQHDVVAEEALNAFVFQIQKAIAAATISLEGLDGLVFTATAGVRSSVLRQMICARLKHLGIQLHPERNESAVGADCLISSGKSTVPVAVMRTDEMGEMAQVANMLV